MPTTTSNKAKRQALRDLRRKHCEPLAFRMIIHSDHIAFHRLQGRNENDPFEPLRISFSEFKVIDSLNSFLINQNTLLKLTSFLRDGPFIMRFDLDAAGELAMITITQNKKQLSFLAVQDL